VVFDPPAHFIGEVIVEIVGKYLLDLAATDSENLGFGRHNNHQPLDDGALDK